MAATSFTPFGLAVLAPFIIDDLSLSAARWGVVAGAVFFVGAFASPVLGPVADAIGGRRVFFAMYALLALAWSLMAGSSGFTALLLATSLTGLVRAASNPAGNRLVMAHAAPGAMGLVMGISKSGAQVAGVLTGVVLPPVALAIGWRGALLTGVLLAALGVAWTVTAVPPDPPRASLRGQRSACRLPAGLLTWLLPHAILVGFSLGSVNAFLPLYLVRDLGYAPSAAGLIAAVMSGVGIAGRILWGRQAELFDRMRAPLTLLTAGSAVGLLGIAAGTHSPALLWSGALLFGATAFGWVPVCMLAIIREAPASINGRVSGLVLMCYYLGSAVSPPALGALADRTESFNATWLTVVVLMFVSAGIVGRGLLRAGVVSDQGSAQAGTAEVGR